jgi:hypothetical protein
MEVLEFMVPVELLREFRLEPRIVLRHPWVVGIPAPEFLIKAELLEKIHAAGLDVMLVPRVR